MDSKIPLPALPQYRQPRVRDLAWAIGSQPLVTCTRSDLSGIDSHGCARELERAKQLLEALDRDPRPLHAALSKPPARRLGRYFENLVAFWLGHSPDFEVLARNLQVRDAKLTHGELDLIVRDLRTGRVGHWEVAVKFYLQLGDPEDLGAWVGPNRRDTLGRKAAHLVQQQCQRARHPVAQQLLASRGIEVDEALLFVKGRLFHARAALAAPALGSLQAAQPAGVRLHAAHARGWWCTASDFRRLASEAGLEWRELEKPNWLADQSGLDRGPETGWLMDTGADLERPLHVVGFLGDQEQERGFVVPEDWALGVDEAP